MLMSRRSSYCALDVSDITQRDLLARIEECAGKKSFRIATVNPEFWLLAGEDPRFRKSLEQADVRLRDGFGLGMLFWLRAKRAPKRVAGADLVRDLLALANDHRWTIFIANRKGGLSTFAEIKDAIQKIYPNVKIEGKDLDIPYKKESLKKKASNAVSKFKYLKLIQNSKLKTQNCEIVFSSMGIPDQEIFLHKLQIQKVNAVMVGVGGSLDYLTGKQKRAPRWMRHVGLEWLYRFYRQPNRARRIWRAVVSFPFFILLPCGRTPPTEKRLGKR